MIEREANSIKNESNKRHLKIDNFTEQEAIWKLAGRPASHVALSQFVT